MMSAETERKADLIIEKHLAKNQKTNAKANAKAEVQEAMRAAEADHDERKWIPEEVDAENDLEELEGYYDDPSLVEHASYFDESILKGV